MRQSTKKCASLLLPFTPGNARLPIFEDYADRRLFSHQLPKALLLDEIVALGEHEKKMSVVKGEKNQDR